MKTGFIHGYPNKSTKKRYSYHGMDRDCLIQPNPDPFDEIPFKPPGPEWKLMVELCWSDISGYRTWYKTGDMLYSSDDDPCVIKWPGGKKAYYFCELSLYPWPGSSITAVSFSSGSQCKLTPYAWSYDPRYWALEEWVWAGSTRMVRVYRAGPGTCIKIWWSETGEKPSYDPSL